MRRFYATILLIAPLLLQPPSANANTESNDGSVGPMTVSATAQSPEDQALAPASGKQEPAPEPGLPATEDKPAPRLSRHEICGMIEQAASEEALPLEFFARLIWQESRFDPLAVSPVGAQGIAQFMPRTANGRGLADPFDALPALFESAEYLRELRNQFGNLGLAAAAYNAGPKRLQDWLAKRGSLSAETRNYVRFITGHSLATWAGAEPPSFAEIALERFHCNEILKLAAQRYRRVLAEGLGVSIAQRTSGSKEARADTPAKAQGFGPARSRLIAKRNGQPSSPARGEQVARVIVSAKHIRIASAENVTARPRNEARGAKVADRIAGRNAARPDRGAKFAKERPNLTIMTDKSARGMRRTDRANTAARSDRAHKVARAVSQSGGASNAKGKATQAQNARESPDRRCSQAKGRKGCREA